MIIVVERFFWPLHHTSTMGWVALHLVAFKESITPINETPQKTCKGMNKVTWSLEEGCFKIQKLLGTLLEHEVFPCVLEVY